MLPQTDEQLKSAITALDFTQILDKMVSHQGWNRADAEEACQLYRNFLFLNAKYPQKTLPPSRDVDEFWHNHILDTKKYHDDCMTVFGNFFHHYPYLGIDGQTTEADTKNAFNEAQALHKNEFGDYIYQINRFPTVAAIMRILKERFK